jgi:hypothetical protein
MTTHCNKFIVSHIGFHTVNLLCYPLQIVFLMGTTTRGRNDMVKRSIETRDKDFTYISAFPSLPFPRMLKAHPSCFCACVPLSRMLEPTFHTKCISALSYSRSAAFWTKPIGLPLLFECCLTFAHFLATCRAVVSISILWLATPRTEVICQTCFMLRNWKFRPCHRQFSLLFLFEGIIHIQRRIVNKQDVRDNSLFRASQQLTEGHVQAYTWPCTF